MLISTAGCGGGDGPDGGGSGDSSPAIYGTPVTQVQAGQMYSFTPSIAGIEGGSGAASYSIENKPSWATFSIATGQLSGMPTTADVGTYSDVVISVSNGTSKVALAPFTIAVTQSTGTGSVTLSWQAPTTNTNGTPVTDLVGYTIVYGASAGDLDRSISVSSPSTTSYTVQNLLVGTWYFALVAEASNGTQSSLSNVVSAAVQ